MNFRHSLGSILITLFSLATIDSLELSRFIFGFIGIGSGIGLAGAAITISNSYKDAQRAPMLVSTDGYFSVAGFVMAWIATYFVGQKFGWSSTYQLIGFNTAAAAVLASISTLRAH